MTDLENHPDAALAQRVGRAERWKRGLIVFIALAVTGLFVVIGVVIARQGETIREIRATQQAGSPSQKRLIELTDLIAGCVTPGQKCYDDGQAATAGAVGSINQITAITVACGDQAGQQTITQIRACVTKQLADLPKEN